MVPRIRACLPRGNDQMWFAGLDVALDLLKEIGDRNNLSYADLFQLASAVAIEVGWY